MSHSRWWPLSQDANKASGVCSVCRATRQWHLKDGTVHKHGPRDRPCAGSHKPPLGAGGDHTVTASTAAANSSVGRSAVPPSDPASAITSVHPQLKWSPTEGQVIKHIPKSARPLCASHLAGVLRAIVAKPHDYCNWLSLFNWSTSILHPPKRGGKRHNLTNSIKKRILIFQANLQWCVLPETASRPRTKHHQLISSWLRQLPLSEKMAICEPLSDCCARRTHQPRRLWKTCASCRRSIHKHLRLADLSLTRRSSLLRRWKSQMYERPCCHSLLARLAAQMGCVHSILKICCYVESPAHIS